MIETVLLYLIGFVVFMFVQGLFVNGVYECFRGEKLVDGVTGKVDYQGMVFYEIAPKFFENNKRKKWSKPFWSCVKCMASVHSAITFWPLVIYFFGWHLIEVPVYILDAFCLVSFNWWIYKKL